MDRARRPGLRGRPRPPSYRPQEGDRRPGGPGRRRPVHHAGRRQGLAVRAHRAARRPAAGALRAARVAGDATRSTASRPTRPAQVYQAQGQPVQPLGGRAGRRGLPVRLHDLPADRAPHRRRHEPLAAVPVRAAAGVLLRGLARAGRASAASSTSAGPRSSPPAPRSRRGCWSPTASSPLHVGGRVDPPDRAALPLGRRQRGRRQRRLGQRPARASPSTRTCTSRSRKVGLAATSARAVGRPGPRCCGCVDDYRSRAGITVETGNASGRRVR